MKPGVGASAQRVMSTLIDALRFAVVANRERHKTAVHFLHIGKCAGSQIKHVSAQVNAIAGRRCVVAHQHSTTLHRLHPDARYFFAIRDPITRFVSGFYSRRRMGSPGGKKPWSDGEKRAFLHFEHANDLAESLFEDSTDGRLATESILSIYHTATTQVSWFVGQGAFLEIRPPVWIVRQERFDEDLATLFHRAGWSDMLPHIEQTRDPVRRHANDYASVPPLSAKARVNLEAWYAQDREFYRMCRAWLEQRST